MTDLETATDSTDLIRTPETISAELKRLHDIDGLTWVEISLLDDYLGIPAGTLCSVAGRYPLPYKWYEHFGIPLPITVEQCEKCGKIHRIAKACTTKQKRKRPHRFMVYSGFFYLNRTVDAIVKHMEKDVIELLAAMLRKKIGA